MDTTDNTLAARLKEAMGKDSAHVASAKLQRMGVEITAQAIYAWLKGGEVKEENLLAFAKVYGVQPAWLRYGVGDRAAASEEDQALLDLFHEMPDSTKQLSLDFIEYQLHKATELVAGEAMGRYMTFISKLKSKGDASG